MTLEPRSDVVRLSLGNWIALLAVVAGIVVPGGAAVISMKSDLAVVKSKQDDAKEALIQQRVTTKEWQDRMDERVLRIERIVKQP